MKNNPVFTAATIIIILISANYILHAQDNRNKDFRLSFGAKYLSRFTAYGIDLASESAAYGLSSSFSHSSGFYADAYFTNPAASNIDAQQTSLDIGYEKDFSDFFTLSAEFNQYFFRSDSANILSQFTNSISFGAEISFDYFDIGLSYDQFLGNDDPSYFSFDISAFHKVGSFYILPMYQAVFMSQSVEESLLHKGKSKKKINRTTSSSTEISGLINSIFTVAVIYPVMKNLSVSFIPALILSHNNDLSSESSLFVWNAGLRYRLNF